MTATSPPDPNARPAGAEGASAHVRPAAVGASLLAAYAVLAAWVFVHQSGAWPHEGAWPYFILIFVCPGIVFQTTSLSWLLLVGRPLTRRIRARIVTVPLGLALAGWLSLSASALAVRGFESAYAPFVERLGAAPAAACAGGKALFEIPSVAAYNLRTQRSRPDAVLHYDSRRFVLAFRGDSIDIDGSTIYYDSGARMWRTFHNDNSEAKQGLVRRTSGLTECPLRAG